MRNVDESIKEPTDKLKCNYSDLRTLSMSAAESAKYAKATAKFIADYITRKNQNAN